MLTSPNSTFNHIFKWILYDSLSLSCHVRLLFPSCREHGNFWYRVFSQGSVATYARCCGIFNNHFIADFPYNLPVKKNNKNWLRFRELLPCVCCLRFYWDMVYSVNNRYLSIFKRCWVMPESCKTFSGSWKSPGMFLQLESVDGGLVVCVCVW